LGEAVVPFLKGLEMRGGADAFLLSVATGVMGATVISSLWR
jgi:hypothetical protein